MAPRRSKFRITGTALLALGCLIVALLFLSVMFGGLFGAETDPVLDGRTYYAVCLKVCDRPEQAEREAAAVRNRNGAGFVWQDKGYRVLAAVYRTRKEQQSVLGKLNAAGENASAYDIVIPSVTVRGGPSENLLGSAFSLFWETEEEVLSLALELDRGREEEAIRSGLEKLAEREFPALGSDAVSIRLRAEHKTLQFNLEMTAAQSPLGPAVKHLSLQILWDLKVLLREIGD